MRALSATELLDAWERGLAQRPPERALTLLAAASTAGAAEALPALSVGRRDAALLALRERLFGPRLVSLADCPSCGERLELEFDVDEIRAPEPDDAETLSVFDDGREVRFRLPQSGDLVALAECGDVDDARALLLRRCLFDQTPDELPAEVIDAVIARMAAADPQADVQLDLACPACGHRWLAVFDVVTFLWSEIHTWAHRTLQDVHRLAKAYGWREPDILALTPWRRQVYLEMAGE
jgi:hypothetical protein